MSDARRRILDASIALVAQQGVREVSFREVARRAGVSHQTPYHHFGDHRGILAEIAREGFTGLAEAMGAAAELEPDPLNALRAAGFAYVRFAVEHVGHFRVMFQQPQEVIVDHDMAERQRPHDVLAALTSSVVAAGYGRGMSADVMAALCWSTVHGLATLLVEEVLPEGSFESTRDAAIRSVVDSLADLFQD